MRKGKEPFRSGIEDEARLMAELLVKGCHHRMVQVALVGPEHHPVVWKILQQDAKDAGAVRLYALPSYFRMIVQDGRRIDDGIRPAGLRVQLFGQGRQARIAHGNEVQMTVFAPGVLAVRKPFPQGGDQFA